MKTDTLFYRLFQGFPSIFFELVDLPPQEAEAYQFSSLEVKQLAFRIDGVFIPPADAPSQPIYFVEVQFQRNVEFYARFFSEIFLYLYQAKTSHPWQAVVIYPSQSIETQGSNNYAELLSSPRVRRIYLDQLSKDVEESVGLSTLQLVTAPEEQTLTRVRQLLQKVSEAIVSESVKQELIELIETIVVYKFPQKSRQEIEAMFGLSELKQTKVYQEALEEGKLEGKLEAVPRLSELGLSLEQIAEALGLTVEQVQQATQT